MENLINDKLQALDLSTVSKRVSDGLARVAEVKKVISNLKEEGKLIDIIDNDDKTGYETSKAFLSRLQKTRTPLEEERKITVKPFNDLVDAVNGEYKAAIAEIEEEEKPRKEKRKLYEENQDRIKDEKLAVAERIIDDKVKRCIDAGLSLNTVNMYYENDMGIACTRMDIQNMDDERFEILIQKVTARKKELAAIAETEILRLEKISKRTDKLVRIGLSTLGSYYVLFNNVTNTNEEVLVKNIEVFSDQEFDNVITFFTDVKNNNLEYQRKQAADKLEQEATAKKLADGLLELKNKQISLWQEHFKDFGNNYSFKYGNPIEDGTFVFKNNQGEVTQNVGKCLEDKSLIDLFVSKAKELIIKQNDEDKKGAQKAIDDAKQRTIDRWNRRIETLIANGAKYISDSYLVFEQINLTLKKDDFFEEDDLVFATRMVDIMNKINDFDLEQASIAAKAKEAKDKEYVKDELLIVDNFIGAMESVINTANNHELEVLGIRVKQFIAISKNNIDNFKEEIKHLR